MGGDRAIGRSHRAALDGQRCGTTLAEQDGAAKTAGSGLGERGARARAGAEERGMRGRPRGRNRDHGLRKRLQESLHTRRDGILQSGQG